MLNLHRILLCTGIDLVDIMQIDCLAYKHFVSIAFHWLVTTLVLCSACIEVHPPPNQPNLHLSEIRISKIDNY